MELVLGTLTVVLIAGPCQEAPVELSGRFRALDDRASAAARDPNALRALGEALTRELWESPPAAWEPFDRVAALHSLAESHVALGLDASPVTYWAWDAALAMRDHGEVERARRLLEGFVELGQGRDADADPFRPWLSIELADFDRYQGRWTRAFEHLDDAKERLVPSGTDPFAAEIDRGDRVRAMALATWFDVRSQVALDLGLAAEAQRYHAEHARRAEAIGDPTLAWAAFINGLRLAIVDERYRDVEAMFAEFRTTPAAGAGLPADWGYASLLVGFAQHERERRGDDGSSAQAEDRLREALDGTLREYDRVFGDLTLAALLNDNGRSTEASKRLAGLRSRTPWLTPSARTDERWDANVLGLQLAYEEVRAALTRDGTDADAGPDLAVIERSFEQLIAGWSDAPVRPGGIAFLRLNPRRELLSVLLSATIERASVRRALVYVLRAQEQGTLARNLGVSGTTVEDVQRCLTTESRGLLVYVAGRTTSHCFLVGPDWIDCVPLAPAFAIDRARRKLLAALPAALTAGAPSDLTAPIAAASELYLPEAVRAGIAGWDEVLIVGLDGWGHVPFECFPGDRAALGTERAIGYLPSLPIGVRLAAAVAERSPVDAGLHVVAATSGEPIDWNGERLDPIQISPTEQAALRASFGDARFDLARAAQLESVRAASPRATLQVIAHGVYDGRRERPAGLLLFDSLGRPAPLWADDVEAADVPALVVLSACGVARGPIRRGDDGRAHWGGALLLAGAACVVSSHFDLELRANVAFSADVHAALAEGASVAEALREARAAAADRTSPVGELTSRLIHAYGASWLRVRDRDRPTVEAGAPKAPGSSPAWLAAVALAALALALGAFARRRVRCPRTGSGSAAG